MWANIAIYSNSELRYIAACAVFRVIFRLIMLVFALFSSNVFFVNVESLGHFYTVLLTCYYEQLVIVE